MPNAKKLLDIKGVDLITAATYVGEVGDIRRFQDLRQNQKLAGFNLVENSSGGRIISLTVAILFLQQVGFTEKIHKLFHFRHWIKMRIGL